MIKKIWLFIKEKFSKTFKLYPVTIMVVVITSIILAIFLDLIEDSEILERILLFSFFFALSSFLAENCNLKKKKLMIAYILAFLMAIIFTVMITSSTSHLATIPFKTSISYILIISILSFYKLYQNSHKKISEYLVKVFNGLLINSLLYGILSLGLLFICTVFAHLLLGGDDYSIIWRVQILLLGIYYIPSVIVAFSSHSDKIWDFMKVIIRYALATLLMISYIVIYLYMIKIFVTWNIPSNQIFRILAFLFIVSVPIWVMNRFYDDNSIYNKINNWFPIIFLPFIFLEIYSLSLRIIANGLTMIRYLGVMLLFFEIFYITTYIFKKEKLEWSYFVLIGLIILSFLVPKYNMIDLSNSSQGKRIIKLLAKKSLSDQDKKVIISSYDYIIDNFNGEEYINKNLKNQKEEIESLVDDFRYHYHLDNILLIKESNPNEIIDINGYQKLYVFDEAIYDEKKDDLFHFDIHYLDQKIDITEIILAYLDNYNESKKISNYEFDVDEYRVIISQISIDYSKELNKFQYISLSGYLLVRE